MVVLRGVGIEVIFARFEDMITTHPKVLSAAVIGIPDLRLGERVCDCVQTLPGERVDLEEIVSYLKAKGVSTSKRF